MQLSRIATARSLRHVESFNAIFMRRELAPFLPAIILAGFWFGIDVMALLGLTAFAVAWLTRPETTAADAALDPVTGLPMRGMAETILDGFLDTTGQNGLKTACLVVGISDCENLRPRLGEEDYAIFLQRIAQRLRAALRDADRIARIDDSRFAVLLVPTPHADLESMIQLAVRLQTSCELALPIGGRTLQPNVHLGICLQDRTPGAKGAAMLDAAENAARQAIAAGPSTIRVFSAGYDPDSETRDELASEISMALDSGQIVAYFQPQISSDTGQVSGMLAVPRWLHRSRGALNERDLLPAIATRDLAGRLHDAMVQHALDALRSWRKMGLEVGPVSLMVTPEIMANSHMADKLRWELDRFDISPDQICLVLRQDVLSRFDEMVVARNISACASMGCAIELSGFGISPVSVESMRRAEVKRVRLPRALVARVDRDADQQRVVAAILSMAEGLRIETVAEDVATLGENALLAQLGCSHLQGEVISPPMPFDDTAAWIHLHLTKLGAAPRIPTHRGV